MPTISLIIPVFNGLKYTQKCLNKIHALINSTPDLTFSVHVVVVDDGSKDGTSEWISTHHPDVHRVYGDGGLWWSGGINKGVDYALNTLNSDYILWWNNDILPRDDYFSQLFSLLEKQPHEVLIGSKIFVLNRDVIWGMGGRFDPRSGARYMFGEQAPDSEEFTLPFEVDWFPGMGTTIHRSVFEKIGYLDEERFPQYHGDSDYTFRAKKAGFKLMVFPQLVISNDVANTGLKHQGSIKFLYQSLTGIKSNYNLEKDIWFYRKHSNSPKAYLPLFNKYFRYVGGFLKWSFLGLVGIRKKSTHV